MACLSLVKSEKLNLTTSYAISPELKDGVQAGIMRNLSSGVELNLQDHMAQMMITSDNICTQIIFQAIEEVTGDALQWINDYCSQLGLHDTLHREVFPRSAELSWSHSIDSMTVTSAHDQALLLELLARGRSEEHTSELQSRGHLVCRLLLEKKKNKAKQNGANRSTTTYCSRHA